MIERFRIEVKDESRETVSEKLDNATTAFLKVASEQFQQENSQSEKGPHWECTDDVIVAIKRPPFRDVQSATNATREITGYRGRRVMVYRKEGS